MKRTVDYRVQEYELDVRKIGRPLHRLIRRGRKRPQSHEGQHEQHDAASLLMNGKRQPASDRGHQEVDRDALLGQVAVSENSISLFPSRPVRGGNR